MKNRLLIFIISFYQTLLFCQTSLKFDIGSGNSSLSDFSILFNDGRFTGQVKFKQVRSTIRDIDFDFKDDYDNEGLKLLLGVVSANADGINISIQEGINDFYIDIGKLSYSINDWDIDIVRNDMIRQIIMSAKIEIQNFKILPPRSFEDNLNPDQLEYFRYFSEMNGEVIVKNMLIDFTLDSDRYFDIKGNLNLPIGKAKLSALMYMGRDFKEDPFFKNLQIDFTSLSPVGKSLMENLINSSNLPLEKKGVGYTLQMAGFFNNNYKVSFEDRYGFDIESSSFLVRRRSMEGTLLVGDYIEINRSFDNINLLGKIIAFKFPRDTLDYDIKRIVASPGDTLEVSDKKLYVNKKEIPMWKNGKYLTSSMLKEFKQPDIFISSETNINRDNLGPIYVPKIGDIFPINEETNWRYLLPIIMMEGHTATLDKDEVSYEFTLQDPHEVIRRKGKTSVYNEYFPTGKLLTPWSKAIQDVHFTFLMIDGRPANELTEYVVTQDYYWVMGDNRDDSLDSRYWGFVPNSLILGYMKGMK